MFIFKTIKLKKKKVFFLFWLFLYNRKQLCQINYCYKLLLLLLVHSINHLSIIPTCYIPEKTTTFPQGSFIKGTVKISSHSRTGEADCKIYFGTGENGQIKYKNIYCSCFSIRFHLLLPAALTMSLVHATEVVFTL